MTKDIERDFKGVWIPKEIWLNTDLSALDKVIYTEICSLDNEFGCTASNEYFADFCNCSISKVSKTIATLKSLGLIEIESFDGRHRKIRVVKNTRQPSKKSQSDCENLQAINIYNNTSNNTSKDITINSNIHNSEDTKQFLNNKPKQKKPNLYTKIVDLINDYTNNEYLRKLLIEYWNICKSKAKQKNKDFFYGHFSGKLDILSELSNNDTNSQIVIVEYSVKNKYSTLYPVHKNNSSSKSMKTVNGKFQDNIEPDRRDTTGKEFEEVNEGF